MSVHNLDPSDKQAVLAELADNTDDPVNTDYTYEESMELDMEHEQLDPEGGG